MRLYRLSLLASIAVLFATMSLHGQSASSAGKVTVETKLSTATVTAGAIVQAAVIAKIQDGWHVNSHSPSFDYLIGTTFELNQDSKAIVSDIQYPTGRKLKFAFADEPLDVYEGRTIVFLSLKLSDKLTPGLDTLHGTLTVQACNDQVCLAPAEIAVNFPIEVVPAGQAVQSINHDLFGGYHPTAFTGTPEEKNDLAAIFEKRGSFVAFLAIFLVGLALNLTPCVYPMLSVTVSLFGGQSETNFVRVFLKAVIYVLGIASMYSVLGVTAALGGGLFGSWLQSPWVLGGIAALLFALALSSFGLYQIQMPYWLTSRLGGQTGTGLIATYLSGLVVGVFAAPCIGPPVIALMTFVGTKGDPIFGFWAFFTLSLGLGFPYLILGTFSGLLKKIPRSGTWLVWVERIFGVVLTAAALFYLSLAVAPKLVQYVVPFSLVVGGAYLGFVDRSGKEKKILQRIQWAFGIAAIALGLVFANGLRQKGMTWEQYSEQRIAAAKSSGKPVVMDFYADWCIPCMELERNTFTDARVINATQDFVRLKVDLTHFDSPESEALRKQFRISGVPTIVFVRADGLEQPSARVIGFLPPAEFVKRIEMVAAK